MNERKQNAGGFYEWASTCDQCGKPRNTGNHQKCSKKRKAEKQKKPDAQKGAAA